MTTALHNWIVSAMLSWVPPLSPADVPRYEAIADDIVTVAREAPLFEEDHAVERTAILLAAIASMESFFRADVDTFERRGDSGKAWGLMQVHLLPGERCDTRLDCLRIGRERVRLSFRLCRAQPEMERLSQFMTGRCQTNADSRFRLFRAKAAMREFMRTKPDGAVAAGGPQAS